MRRRSQFVLLLALAAVRFADAWAIRASWPTETAWLIWAVLWLPWLALLSFWLAPRLVAWLGRPS